MKTAIRPTAAYRRWLSFSAALLFALLFVQTASAVEVVKSPQDHRQYEYFVLPNDMKVLLISDPDTDKAAASMDVNVGSSSDPRGRQGLAHFLEHMLFLGTKKYPSPGEYQQFINAHGGENNAFTAFEDTNFHFDIDKDHLEPALDRFSQFFIAPLFTPEYVEREKNAVNSEYQAKISDDDRRGYSVLQQVINPAHPMSQFSVGSLATLADRPGSKIRDELIRFYKAHYSADLMSLVVLGKEPLPVLHKWVAERFGAVPNTGATALAIKAPLFKPGTLPLRLNVEPLKDTQELQIVFPLPPAYKYYREKPLSYIGNFVGDEGKGSLLSLLKANGWVDQLSAGAAIDDRNESAFVVSIKLTDEGLKHVDAIVGDVFGYLRLLRDKGVAAWRYQELARISDLSFRFAERSEPASYVTGLASEMQYVSPDDIVRANYMMTHFDPQLIKRFLDRLTPDNSLVALMAKGVKTDRKDPWYGTPYSATPIKRAELQAWNNAPEDPRLALPAKNPFIAEDVALKSMEPGATAVPVRIEDRKNFELWFKQDGTFRQPRDDFYFSVRSAIANDSPAHAVLTDIYTRIISDQLDEFTYPATLAGLSYQIYPHIRGFSVRISGYNDKQPLLLDQIVKTLKHPRISDERFNVIKDTVLRQLYNVRHERPYEQTLAEVSKLLIRPSWSEKQRLAAGKMLTADDLRRFVPQLLKNVYVIAMAHGNLHRQDAISMAAILDKALVRSDKPADVAPAHVVKLTPRVDYFRWLKIDHPDSTVVAYFQGASQAPSEHARFGMLAQIVSTPFYEDLRTEKQLGYIVSANNARLLNVPGIEFLVQSPTTDPLELMSDIHQFLKSFATRIDTMSPADFASNKLGLITRILQRDDRLQTRSDRYWRELDLGYYHFDTRMQIADAVRRLTLKEFKAFFHQAVEGPARKELVVANVGTNRAAEFAGKKMPSDTVIITRPEMFGSKLPFFTASRSAAGVTSQRADASDCTVSAQSC